MANLREVAELAGVSIATASMALRGGGNIRESTRLRVMTCAKRLNYTPNQIGRTLNTGKANAIALLMMTSAVSADIVRGTSLFYHLVRGVLSVVDEAKHGLRLDVKSHEDPDLMQYFEQVVGDYMAAGAMKVLAESELRVPEDVVIVGYDNTDICIGLTPTLTTVDYRAEEVGRCLAGELLALIEGKVSSIQKAIQPFLVERESHGPSARPDV